MAVNDEIFKNLAQYGGGTINERVYNFLGSLGYTGTINDRLGQFEEGGRKGWQGLIRAWGQWAPAQLFSQGQEGVWYEPKPIVAGQQVLYQDSAGTVPVTADGDPVGLMLDRSRGMGRGRVNLIRDSESFDSSFWSINAATITPDTDIAPDGVLSADTIEISSSTGSAYQAIASTPGVSYTGSVYVKDGTGSSSDLRLAFYDETNGVFIDSAVVPEAGEAEEGFTRYYASATAPAGCESLRFYPIRGLIGVGNTVVIWGAQMEAGALLTEYQSANPYWYGSVPGNHATQSTSAARPIYRTDGVLHWLQFDGVDDFFKTGYFAGGVENTIAAAFSLSGDQQIIVGLQQTNGRLYLSRKDNAIGGGWGDHNWNTIIGGDGAVKGVSILAGDSSEVFLRNNAAEVYRSASAGQPSTAREAYVGAHNNAGSDSLFANGALYGAIATHQFLTGSETAGAESHLAKLAGVTL